MSTIGYAKLTGMKEFTPFISPLGDVVNVESLNTAHGWIGLNVTWPLWGCLYVLTLSEGCMTEDEYGSFSEEDYENEYRYSHGC